MGLLASGFARLRFRGRKTLFWIILAAMSFSTVFAVLGAWSIHLWARLVLEEPSRKTIVTGIAMFADAEGGQRLRGPRMATSWLSALSVVLLFLAAQRFISEAFAPGSAEH